MRVVFFGTPEFAVPSLARLLAEPDLAVVGVVTQPDQRRGRGSQVEASPVKQLGLQAGCPILQPQRLNRDQASLKSLAEFQADVFVVVAYGQILSQALLALPRWGCINGHGSLLPAYRGAAPIQRCIVDGQTLTGMTIMQMDRGMDTGAMLLKSSFPIGLLDNFVDVAEALAHQCADLLVATLAGLEAQTLVPEPQDGALASYAPLIQKEEYGLDWSRPAIALHNQIRGLYPHCVTSLRGQPLKIMATAPLLQPYWQALPPELAALEPWVASLESTAPAGTLVGLLKGHGPVVQTGHGYLLLRQVKPSGKQVQRGADFLNGSHLRLGERMGIA
ncbi:MAG: methionyl-tRNA formyltransferase [Cyanobacteria bacterium REEB459]|nr:methionyl-tRNA formyltransferase [Cyanobacteria bacterium REEB459]